MSAVFLLMFFSLALITSSLSTENPKFEIPQCLQRGTPTVHLYYQPSTPMMDRFETIVQSNKLSCLFTIVYAKTDNLTHQQIQPSLDFHEACSLNIVLLRSHKVSEISIDDFIDNSSFR